MLGGMYSAGWGVVTVLRKGVFPWQLKAVVLPRARGEAGGVPFLWSLTTTLSSNVKSSFCLNRECRGFSARGGEGRMNLSLSTVKVLLETTLWALEI